MSRTHEKLSFRLLVSGNILFKLFRTSLLPASCFASFIFSGIFFNILRNLVLVIMAFKIIQLFIQIMIISFCHLPIILENFLEILIIFGRSIFTIFSVTFTKKFLRQIRKWFLCGDNHRKLPYLCSFLAWNFLIFASNFSEPILPKKLFDFFFASGLIQWNMMEVKII